MLVVTRGAEGPGALQVLVKPPMVVSDHLFTPGGTGSVPSHKSVSPYNKEENGTARRPSLPERIAAIPELLNSRLLHSIHEGSCRIRKILQSLIWMKLLGKKASVTGSVQGIEQAVGINVNNIAPGAIDTLSNTKLLNDPDTFNALLENIPLARSVWRSDVAFRTSPDVDYNTGATINVDGGLTWNYNEQ